MIALYWNFFVLNTSQAKTVEVIGQQKRPEKAAATPIGMTYSITFIRLQKYFEIGIFLVQFAEHLVSSGARGGGNFDFGSARVALSEHSGERGGNSSGCCGTSVGAAALCEWNFVEIYFLPGIRSDEQAADWNGGGRSAGRMAQFEVDTSLCRIHCSNLEEHSVYGAGMSCRKTVDST